MATTDALPVEVEALVARYGQQEVLSGVDLRVRRSEVRVILGGSGSGKSTLLKHVVGLHRPAAGVVRVLGTELHAVDEPQREALMARVGVLFQNGALINSLSLRENIALPMRERWSLPEDVLDELVHIKLALVNLEHAAGLTPRELSGGMVKRAALARAMALDPEVLFCDEPSAGLDPVTAAELDWLILGLRERFGTTVVVVTHELESIRTIADSVTMLGSGRVIADGPLREVQGADDPRVQAFFGRSRVAQSARRASLRDALASSRGDSA